MQKHVEKNMKENKADENDKIYKNEANKPTNQIVSMAWLNIYKLQ